MQALNFASRGMTTLEEVFRIAGEISEEMEPLVIPGAGAEPSASGGITG
jgi:hypothetical protein